MNIELRPINPITDSDEIFQWNRDPESVRMAAFTPEHPDDRSAFDAHQAQVLSNPENRSLAILRDGKLVGTIAAFTQDGKREVTYWIDRALWGQGIATAALTALLEQEPVRPLWGRASAANRGSRRVLEHAGFSEVGRDHGWAFGVGADTEEIVMRLD